MKESGMGTRPETINATLYPAASQCWSVLSTVSKHIALHSTLFNQKEPLRGWWNLPVGGAPILGIAARLLLGAYWLGLDGIPPGLPLGDCDLRLYSAGLPVGDARRGLEFVATARGNVGACC